MKKKFWGYCLAGLMTTSILTNSHTYGNTIRNDDPSVVRVFVNEELIIGDVPCFIKDGETLVPIRFYAEATQMTLKTDQGNNAFGLYHKGSQTTDDKSFEFSKVPKLYIDDELVQGESPLCFYNGRAYVRLKTLVEHMGGKIHWEKRTNFIHVSMQKKTTVTMGTLMYPNGDVYEGGLKNGKRHGRGKLVMSNGDVYEGAFYEDKKHGYGKYTVPSIGTYTGYYKDDQMHGKGELVFNWGDVKSGDWKNDLCISQTPATTTIAANVSTGVSTTTPQPSEKPENKPVEKPNKPVEKPDKPVEKPDKPVEKPDKPVEKPDKPVEKPDKPVEKPDKPVEKPDKPSQEKIYINEIVSRSAFGMREITVNVKSNVFKIVINGQVGRYVGKSTYSVVVEEQQSFNIQCYDSKGNVIETYLYEK